MNKLVLVVIQIFWKYHFLYSLFYDDFSYVKPMNFIIVIPIYTHHISCESPNNTSCKLVNSFECSITYNPYNVTKIITIKFKFIQ